MGTQQLRRIGKGGGTVLIVFGIRVLADQVLGKGPGVSILTYRESSAIRYLPDNASGGRLPGQRRCHPLGSCSAGRRSCLKDARASGILPRKY